MNNIKNKNIKTAIIETIVFFDLFDCPLTDMEIWQYLEIKCDYGEVRELLKSGIMLNVLGMKNGFYFLAGREEIYVTRMKRYNYAARKFKRALLMAKIFKIVPWIKLICVGNLMGANNLKDESDIDLFIITEKERVWLTRLACVVITMILRLRPSEKNNRDTICLSFFISENGMELKEFLLPVADPYFTYWLAGLVPIYDKVNTYEKLIEANIWIYDTLPNWLLNKPSRNRQAGQPWPRLYHNAIDFLKGWLEPALMRWQIKRLPKNLKEMMNKDTRVVINDGVIKMHGNDRRAEYLEKFKSQMSKVKNTIQNSKV